LQAAKPEYAPRIHGFLMPQSLPSKLAASHEIQSRGLALVPRAIPKKETSKQQNPNTLRVFMVF
jgi:hypothetical protein